MPEREPGTQGVSGHWPDFPDPMAHNESDAYGAGDNLINDETAVVPVSRKAP